MTLGLVRLAGAPSPQVFLGCPGGRAAALHQRAIKGWGRLWFSGIPLGFGLGRDGPSFLVYPCLLKDILTQFIFWARDSELLVSNRINLNKGKNVTGEALSIF